jgi:serine/threonine-protein kinase
VRYRRRRGLGGGRSGGKEPSDDGGETGASQASGGGRGGKRGGGPGGGDGTGDGGGGRLRRWAILVAGLVVLVGAGYLVSAWWLFPASAPDARAGEVVDVPDLVGLAEEEARRALEEAGLEYRLRSEMPHPRAPSGAVVAQSPLPGQYARPGAPVEVTLSLGPQRQKVPDLRGLSDRQARIVLERLGFRTDVDTASSQVERGRVVGTRPDPGTDLQVPADVTVVVSRGPRTARVPELVGMHVDDVEEQLGDRGLEMGEISYDPEAFAAPGRVIGQSPSPGYSLRVGGRVSIRVAGEAPARPDSLPGAVPDTAGVPTGGVRTRRDG